MMPSRCPVQHVKFQISTELIFCDLEIPDPFPESYNVETFMS